MNPANSYTFEQGEVRYGITGDGPDLVLVHGTPWSSYTWRHVIDALQSTFRIHFYDYIGYGASEKRANQRVSLDVQAQLLAELLDHWQLERPAVVAHDFGGATTLRAHLLAGCEYRSLTLIDVVALAPWGSPFFAHVKEHEAAFAGVPPYIHKAVVEAYIKGAAHQALDVQDLEALVNPWLGEDNQPAFYRQIAQAEQRYTDEVEPLYGEIRCPVSILWGEQDEWIPVETGQRLAGAIPDARFIPVADAGHLVLLEQPEAVVSILRDVLG